MTSDTPSAGSGLGRSLQRARGIAKAYAVYGVVMAIIAIFVQPKIWERQVTPLDAVGPLTMAGGALALLKGKRIGFYVSFLWSVILLLAVPVGTVVGAFMIHSLWRARAHFSARAISSTGTPSSSSAA